MGQSNGRITTSTTKAATTSTTKAATTSTTKATTTSKSSTSSTIATSRTTTIHFISSSSTNSTNILPAQNLRNIGGIAAGATIAVLVVLSLIAAAIFFFVYRRKLRRSQRDASVRTRHSKLNSDNTQHCNTLPRYDDIDEQFDSEMNPPYNGHTYNEVFDQIYNKAGPIHPSANTVEASCPVDHTNSSSIDPKGSSDIPRGPIYTIASSSEQRVTASHDQQQNVNNNKNPNSGNPIQDSNNKTRPKLPLPDPGSPYQQSSVYSLSQPVPLETHYTSPPPDSRTQPIDGTNHACENAYVELEKMDNVDMNMQQDTPTYFVLEKDIYPDNYK